MKLHSDAKNWCFIICKTQKLEIGDQIDPNVKYFILYWHVY